MCDLVGNTQSADNLRSNAGVSTSYRPYAEFLEALPAESTSPRCHQANPANEEKVTANA
jgi:hypothetical protein